MDLNLVRKDELFAVIAEALKECVDSWVENTTAAKEVVFQFIVLDILMELLSEFPEVIEEVSNDSGEPELNLSTLLFLLALAAEDFRELALQQIPDLRIDTTGPSSLKIISGSPVKEEEEILRLLDMIRHSMRELSSLPDIPRPVLFQLSVLQAVFAAIASGGDFSLFLEDFEGGSEILLEMAEAITLRRPELMETTPQDQ
ncbi:MAG: hypothetical protein PHC51_06290 [bacterium]|nr:hypothetical protein [bacterium]